MIPTAVRRSAAALAALAFTGCASTPKSPLDGASASLIDARGDVIGSAAFTGHADGSVTVALVARGLLPGSHAVHIHSIGSCTAPDFASAGGHFNPLGKAHGLQNPAGPHSGDLPDIVVSAEGVLGYYRTITARVTIGPGQISILDADGSAIVIHATADDNRTDPSGNSGSRVACGVIRAAT